MVIRLQVYYSKGIERKSVPRDMDISAGMVKAS